jgi:hypothetical protein
MTTAPSRRLVRRLLALALVAPLVLVSIVGYLAISEGSSGARLPVAQGSQGGVLHPIAGQFVADDTVLADCGTDNQCLEQGFGNLSFREGPVAALTLFEERLRTDPVVEKDCHRISHFIGAAALERFDGNIAKTFSLGSAACVSGYYHGILERAFLGITSKPSLVEAARSLCAAEGIRRRGFLDYQCRHGLGHGLMIQTGYDLPLALSLCARLGTGWDRKACAGGAFMENINTRFGFRSSWLDDTDPLYPCRLVGAPDKRSCYLRSSWRILVLEGGSFEKTAAACAQLGSWESTCFQGYGRDAAENARYAPSKTIRLCRLAAGGEADCLLGAARTIANASGARGIAPSAALCRQVAHRLQDSCYAGIGLVLGMLHATGEARREACAKLTRPSLRACVRAAEAEVDPSGLHSWG